MTIVNPIFLLIFFSPSSIAATKPEVIMTTHMSLPANSSEIKTPPAYVEAIPRIPKILMTF